MRVYAHVQTFLSHLHGNAFRNVFLSEVDVFLIVIDVCSLLVRVLYVCAEVHGVARSCTDCVGRLHGVARSCTDCVGGSRSSVLFLLARCGFLKYLLISY